MTIQEGVRRRLTSNATSSVRTGPCRAGRQRRSTRAADCDYRPSPSVRAICRAARWPLPLPTGPCCHLPGFPTRRRTAHFQLGLRAVQYYEARLTNERTIHDIQKSNSVPLYKNKITYVLYW